MNYLINYLIIVAILMLGLWPLLVPLTAGAIHAIVNWRRTYEWFGSVVRRESLAVSPAT